MLDAYSEGGGSGSRGEVTRRERLRAASFLYH